MPTVKSLLILGCALAVTAAAQTPIVLWSSNFEAASGNMIDEIPDGWGILNTPNATVRANLTTGGINASAQALYFNFTGSGNSDIHTGEINLSSYATATDFSLSFDLWVDFSTSHAIIFNFFRTSGGEARTWVGAADGNNVTGGTMLRFNPTTIQTWQTFTFSGTELRSFLDPFLTAGATDFRVGFQNWSGTTGFNAQHTYIDNVILTVTPIPEPGAFAALAGLATLGLATTRRRRRVS